MREILYFILREPCLARVLIAELDSRPGPEDSMGLDQYVVSVVRENRVQRVEFIETLSESVILRTQ